jgi:hypothetical protein
VEFYQVTLPGPAVAITLYSDSTAALARVNDLEYQGFGTTWRCRENYDMEAAIRNCISRSPVKITWKWVRGHASRRKEASTFGWNEILNEEADKSATLARSETEYVDKTHWPEQIVSVSSDALGRFNGKLTSELRYCCTAPDIKSYWCERYNWTAQQVNSVDITGTKAAMSKLPNETRARIQKLRCGWLPTNSRESRIDPDRESGCKSCSSTNLVEETVDHIFQCESVARRSAVLAQFDKLHYDFRTWKTSEHIIAAIRAGALAWIKGIAIPSIESLNLPNSRLGNLTKEAYLEQTTLGWHTFFRGFWTNKWRHAQEEQFRINESRERQDTGERWAGKAQSWFFSMFNTIWLLRNETQHGADEEAEMAIRRETNERAITRLYAAGASLPYGEKHPFRDPIATLLHMRVVDQELWISKTAEYLPKALRRVRKKKNDNQALLTDFFMQR